MKKILLTLIVVAFVATLSVACDSAPAPATQTTTVDADLSRAFADRHIAIIEGLIAEIPAAKSANDIQALAARCQDSVANHKKGTDITLTPDDERRIKIANNDFADKMTNRYNELFSN